MLQRLSITALVALAACTVAPPKADVVRTGTTVNASAGKVWDAVIEQFADRNIPIRTIERASGLIATEPLAVSGAEYKAGYYDCGSNLGSRIPATQAVYNALVRGDSTHATVRVTVKWSGRTMELVSSREVAMTCTTQGGWESEFEAAVKAAAEQPR